jgi:hypothetical protein
MSFTGRLAVASERGFGEVEHVVVSVPPVDRNLSETVLREKCMRAMLVRGVLGGAKIFHGFRIDKVRKVLVWSPHFHSLSFISGALMSVVSVCMNVEIVGHVKPLRVVRLVSMRKTVIW